MRLYKSNICIFILFSLLAFAGGCSNSARTSENDSPAASVVPEQTIKEIPKIKNPARIIHVLVALCDNENQGIVPVPAHLGNGEDPAGNLYWGAAFGVKTYFTKSSKWEKVAEFENPGPNILERIVFKYRTENVYLVADAYRGIKMRETISDFFGAISGAKLENIKADDSEIQIYGSADLVAFVGHNGLMDFEPPEMPARVDENKREAIILACLSRKYFATHLEKTNAAPLLWTSNLMAPESYILHDALEGWIGGETDEQIRDRAALAYSKYQKISHRAARGLLVTGF